MTPSGLTATSLKGEFLPAFSHLPQGITPSGFQPPSPGKDGCWVS
ncbi:hypothetical protein [Synechococcus sp. BDU 130192]|nr:hypothetical protein [Synechococcus sp. BDU 130192]